MNQNQFINYQQIQEQIQNERGLIQQNGANLILLKNQAYEQNQRLPVNYANLIFKQIRRIAQHDIDCRNQYNANQQAQYRRSNLGNLALTAKLFRDGADLFQYNPKLEYNSQLAGYVNTNIFDDLEYLCSFDIVAAEPNNPLYHPLYHITDNEVNLILNGLCQHLVGIANIEIGQQPDQVEAIRNQYRDHRALPALFVFTSYHREITHIVSAIRAINVCIDLLNVPLNLNAALANKRAVLRGLTIIGEAFTQINLTPATRGLNILSQNELQLFKNIRDKLEHSEFDIHQNNVENYINQNNMVHFINELALLIRLLDTKLRALYVIRNANQLDVHYLGNNQNNNHQNRFPQIQNFYNNNLQPLTNNLLQQHRQQFPNDFTPQAMLVRMRAEIAIINHLLVNIPGMETLRDPHPEVVNTVIIREDMLNYFLYNLRQLNHNYNGSNEAIDNLGNVLPLVPIHHLNVNWFVLELPAIHANGIFVNNNAGNYLIQNFNDIANAIMRYERKLTFIRFLQNSPAVRLTIEYHICRVAKFMSQIPLQDLLPLLAPMQEPEIRAFRNAIAHDLEEIIITGIPMEGFICRYLANIVQMLAPQVQPQAQLHMPGP